MKRSSRPRTAIIGAGRLGRAIAPLLPARGYAIDAVADRKIGAARALCRRIRGATATSSVVRACSRSELILLAVPDREIGPVADRLARAKRDRGLEGKVVLHFAGALGPEPLEPVRGAGAEVGVMHPLQVLSDAASAEELLSGSRARIEGTPRARTIARRLARDLGLAPLRFSTNPSAADRVAYHAAAALAGNDLLALLDAAARLLESTGVSRSAAVESLSVLARGALHQVGKRGLSGALTGPVIRGDVETVAAHLHELERRSPDDAALHRELSRRLIELAAAEGRELPAQTRRDMLRLLDAGRRRKPGV